MQFATYAAAVRRPNDSDGRGVAVAVALRLAELTDGAALAGTLRAPSVAFRSTECNRGS